MIAILLLAIVPFEQPLTDHVDLIEINHYYNEHAKPVFSQLLFYDWDGWRYQVRAWRLLKSPLQLPQRDWATGNYRAAWFDGNIFRQVTAGGVVETWTQHDPELPGRDILPKEQRRELTKPNGSNP